MVSIFSAAYPRKCGLKYESDVSPQIRKLIKRFHVCLCITTLETDLTVYEAGKP